MHEHTSPPTSPSRPTSTRVAVRIVLLGTLGVAVGALPGEFGSGELTPPLHAAAPASSYDTDGDGLPDLLELRLGLLPDQLDSDGDGYEDAEEVARKSDGMDASSVPASGPISAALEVYQDGGPLRPVSILYSADGEFGDKPIAMGARVGQVLRYAPVSYFMSMGGSSLYVPGKKAGSRLLVIDGTFEVAHITRFGSLSIFTTISHDGLVVSADVSNVADVAGTVVEVNLTKVPGPSMATGGSGGVARYGPVNSSTVPGDWTPGQICAQTVVVSGTVGAAVISEVIDASCESGWDSYCDPNCSGTVGTTFEVLEPGALIGG